MFEPATSGTICFNCVTCSCAILLLRETISLDTLETLFNQRAETMQSTAQDYWSSWKQFVLHGVMQEDVLPPALIQSWRRCVTLGLDHYGVIVPEAIPNSTSTTVSQKLLSLVRPSME